MTNNTEQQAVPVAQEYPATAIGALTGYQRQIDSDGTFVGVSRQALDELIAWAEARRLPHPCKSGEGADAVAWCSPGQLANLMDVDVDGGVYLPIRKTGRGNFTMPLYSHPVPAPDAIPTREAECPSLEALARFITDHEGNDETSDGLDVDRRAREAVSNLRSVVSAALAVCHSGDDDCTNGRVVTIDPDAFDALNAALDIVGDSEALPDATQTREAEAWQDAWNEFFNEHLTDGNDGYRSADVISQCRAAFDAAWIGGEKPANDAARAALNARGGA